MQILLLSCPLETLPLASITNVEAHGERNPGHHEPQNTNENDFNGNSNHGSIFL